MGYLESIILGIVQGLTEFLPISSSGHIEVAKFFMDKFYKPIDIENNIEFTLFLHLGTVLSTIVAFRKDIVKIITGLFFSNKELTSRPYVGMILLSLLPLIPMYFLKDTVEELGGNIVFVGFMLLITGVILGLTQIKPANESTTIGPKQSILIGLAQAVAVIPGISRSGSTIATALLLGVSKTEAARFSFLMVLPAIIGGAILDIPDAEFIANGSSDLLPLYLVGFMAAFITGLFACNIMIALVKKQQLIPFSVYCLIIGLVCIFFGWETSLAE